MSTEEIHEYQITLTREKDYKFTVDFGKETIPALLTDEGEEVPGGEGLGPTPAMLLAAAVGNCLAASLTFCLTKRKVELQELKVNVRYTRERNQDNLWRISKIFVDLYPIAEKAEDKDIKFCLSLFKKYCIVSMSVEQGIPMEINVEGLDIKK